MGHPTRRVLGVFAATGLSLLFASCSAAVTKSAAPSAGSAGSVSGGSSPSIYFIGFTQQQAFWHTVQAGAEQAGRDFGARVVYEAPDAGSDAAMTAMIQSAIGSKPAGIAIDYAGKDMEAATSAALAAGIAVTLYNNDRFEPNNGQAATTDPAITSLPFVGQDETHSGEVLAQAFLQYMPSSGRVLVINPNPASLVVNLRTAAVKDFLSAAGYQPDVLVESADPTQDLQLTTSYLQAHPDTKGILSTNVNGIDPAAKAVSAGGLSIPVGGFDTNSVVLQDVKAGGPVKILLYQQPYLQGYLAVENLVLEVKDGFAGVKVNTGTLIINKSNVDHILNLVAAGRG